MQFSSDEDLSNIVAVRPNSGSNDNCTEVCFRKEYSHVAENQRLRSMRPRIDSGRATTEIGASIPSTSVSSASTALMPVVTDATYGDLWKAGLLARLEVTQQQVKIQSLEMLLLLHQMDKKLDQVLSRTGHSSGQNQNHRSLSTVDSCWTDTVDDAPSGNAIFSQKVYDDAPLSGSKRKATTCEDKHEGIVSAEIACAHDRGQYDAAANITRSRSIYCPGTQSSTFAMSCPMTATVCQ